MVCKGVDEKLLKMDREMFSFCFSRARNLSAFSTLKRRLLKRGGVARQG